MTLEEQMEEHNYVSPLHIKTLDDLVQIMEPRLLTLIIQGDIADRVIYFINTCNTGFSKLYSYQTDSLGNLFDINQIKDKEERDLYFNYMYKYDDILR